MTIPLKKSFDRKNKEFDRLSVSLNGTLRFGRNASRPVDERIGIALNYQLNKYISLSPDVLYRGYQPYRGRKEFESRFRFAVILANKWKYFSLNDRTQVEYRLRNSRQNAVFYKNRLRFDVPVTKNKREFITPFISDEPYYNFQAHNWSRNEFFAGISKKINKNMAADFYYLLVNEKGFPKMVNGIGVNFKFKVD